MWPLLNIFTTVSHPNLTGITAMDTYWNPSLQSCLPTIYSQHRRLVNYNTLRKPLQQLAFSVRSEECLPASAHIWAHLLPLLIPCSFVFLQQALSSLWACTLAGPFPYVSSIRNPLCKLLPLKSILKCLLLNQACSSYLPIFKIVTNIPHPICPILFIGRSIFLLTQELSPISM